MPVAVKSAAESARVSVASADESTDGKGATTVTESQRRETREDALPASTALGLYVLHVEAA